MNEQISRYGDFSKQYYLPARPYGLALFRCYFRLTFTGIENIPATGPAILVPNHTSFLDPPLLSAVVPRVVYFLMLHTLYYHRWLHWLFSRLPCIPMKRGSIASTTALRMCLEALNHGQVLCVFPEGGISLENKASGIKSGAALLASRTQAPIIPVGIRGSEDALPLKHILPRPRRISMRFGAPIFIPSTDTRDKELLQTITEKTMATIRTLLAEE